MKEERKGGRKEREIESRREFAERIHGKHKNTIIFQRKTISFQKNNRRLFCYKVPFYRNKERELW